MHLQPVVKKLLPIFLCLVGLFFWVACENNDHNTDQLPKRIIVSRKIQMDPAEIEKPVSPQNDISTETSPVQEVDQEKNAGQEDGDAIISTGVISSENDLILEVTTTAGLELYNPENKIDPFMPLFREKPKAEIEIFQKIKREKRIPRTPLERIDLSRLKLVGIIQLPSGYKGLVEESSGKGYIISMGTYLGTNGGKVVEISKDRVIVDEEVDDVLDKLILQRRELTIQKSLGEN